MEPRAVSAQEGYERWAATYDLDPNPLLALEERQLRLMVPPLPGRCVLDLACGTGRWLVRLVSGGARQAVGVDFSPAMLAGARRKVAICGRVALADCRALPFGDAAFDLVICSFAAAHIPELPKVAQEVWRVAAPGTDLYLSDLHPLASAQGWHTGFHDQQGPAEIVTWSRSVEDLRAVWESSGFDCIQTIDCRLGEEEKSVFARAGKLPRFEAMRSIPLVLLCHFRRRSR